MTTPNEDESERLFKLLLAAIKGDASTLLIANLQPNEYRQFDLGTVLVAAQGRGMHNYAITVIAHKVDL